MIFRRWGSCQARQSCRCQAVRLRLDLLLSWELATGKLTRRGDINLVTFLPCGRGFIIHSIIHHPSLARTVSIALSPSTSHIHHPHLTSIHHPPSTILPTASLRFTPPPPRWIASALSGLPARHRRLEPAPASRSSLDLEPFAYDLCYRHGPFSCCLLLAPFISVNIISSYHPHYQASPPPLAGAERGFQTVAWVRSPPLEI